MNIWKMMVSEPPAAKSSNVKVIDFNPIGRNTQGVRIMSLEEGDTLAAIVCVPKEEREEDSGEAEMPTS
jgi:DNA gyrase subunit A